MLLQSNFLKINKLFLKFFKFISNTAEVIKYIIVMTQFNCCKKTVLSLWTQFYCVHKVE